MAQQFQQQPQQYGQQTRYEQQSQFGQQPPTQQGGGGQQVGGQPQQGTTQQPGQPGASRGFQQAGGQQMTGQQVGAQQYPREFEDSLPSELRVVLHDVNKVAHVAEWCADRCLDQGPQMAECVRVCEDLADIADLNEKMISRDSKYGPELAEAFVKVAQQGIQDLQQFQGQSPTVEETISVIQRALDSSQKELQQLGIQIPTGGQMTGGQMSGGQMSGGQTMGAQTPGGQMGGQQSF